MKKILCLLGVTVLLMVKGYSHVTFQIIPGQSKINYLKSETGGNSSVVQTVEVKVTFWGPEQTTDEALSFVITHPYTIGVPLTPVIVNTPVGGYFIPAKKIKPKPDTMIFKVNIQITATPAIASEEFFDLRLVGFVATTDPRHRVTITTTSTEEEEAEAKAKKKSLLLGIKILNAYNFDFGATSLSSNYVGHLNLFAPSLNKKKKWGFNTGIMKINYGQKDTSNSSGTIIRENVFINPFDTLAVGLKYLKQFNSYKTELKNTVWSFYAQPLYELTTKGSEQHVYAHVHLELLASKWSSTTTITNVKQDTGVITNLINTPVLRSGLTSNNTYTVNSLSGYFGTGFTFDLKPWDGSSFFFQPTIGITSNTPSPASTDIGSNIRSSSVKRGESIRNWRVFYLVRASYRQTLSKDATVIVGMDIRGLLPLYAPQYAAFVGLNLGLDSILGLLGGKGKE